MAEPPSEIDIIAAFGGTTDYGQQFAIYIPNKDRDGAPVDQATWIDAALRLLTDTAGGASAMPPVTGAWRYPQTGQVVIEGPVVVYAYVKPASFVARLAELAAFVRRIGRETKATPKNYRFAVRHGRTAGPRVTAPMPADRR